MSYQMTKVGEVPHTEYLCPAPDILVASPEPGYKDTPDLSRLNIEFQRQYAHNLGQRCGLVIVMNNLLAQDGESRRMYYNGTTPDLFYGVALVVGNPLARALGTFTLNLTTLKIPMTLVDTVDKGIAWLEGIRKEQATN